MKNSIKSLVMFLSVLLLNTLVALSQNRSAMDAFDNLEKEEQKVSPVAQPKPAAKQEAATVAPEVSAQPTAKAVSVNTSTIKNNKHIEIKGNNVNFIGDNGKVTKRIQLKDEKRNDTDYVLVSRVLAFPSGNQQFVGIATEQSRVLPEYSIISTTTFHYYGVDGKVVWDARNVVIAYDMPAIWVSSFGDKIIISTGTRPEDVDIIDYPQAVSLRDNNGCIIWDIGEYAGISDFKVSDNGHYACFSFEWVKETYPNYGGCLFIDIANKKTHLFRFDEKIPAGYCSIDDNGKAQVFFVESKLSNPNDENSPIINKKIVEYEYAF